ncbi:MAG: ABC transporter permease [Bacillaceae bacterium]|nr:ABC transporter permease [Bacillaceae bacterium]
MMTCNQLFIDRVKREWRYQISVWRTAVDWTVALYVVLPIVTVFLYFYISLWQTIPAWMGILPADAVIPVLLLFFVSGNLRLFIQEGDLLVFLSRPEWFSAIRKRGLLYSMGVHFLGTLLFVILLMPFLLYHFELGPIHAAAFIIFASMSKFLFLFVGEWLEIRRYSLWKKGPVYAVMFAVFFAVIHLSLNAFVWMTMFTLAGGMALPGMFQWRSHLHAFSYDQQLERRHRTKYSSLILGVAGMKTSSAETIRKSPLIFPKSGRLFRNRNPYNGLAEAFIKSQVRNGKKLFYLAQILGITLYAAIVVPPGLTGLMLVAGLGMWIYMIHTYWRSFLQSSTIRLFPFLPSDRKRAWNRAIMIATLPAAVTLALVWAGFIL